jgi:hypothetical protein
VAAGALALGTLALGGKRRRDRPGFAALAKGTPQLAKTEGRNKSGSW